MCILVPGPQQRAKINIPLKTPHHSRHVHVFLLKRTIPTKSIGLSFYMYAQGLIFVFAIELIPFNALTFHKLSFKWVLRLSLITPNLSLSIQIFKRTE